MSAHHNTSFDALREEMRDQGDDNRSVARQHDPVVAVGTETIASSPHAASHESPRIISDHPDIDRCVMNGGRD